MHFYFWGRGDSSYGYTYGDRDTIYHPYTLSFWRLGDVGTIRTDIHMEIGTQYTTPIHSQFWRLGDVGIVPKDIHTEIGTQYTTPILSHFWRLWNVGTVPTDIDTATDIDTDIET